MNNAENNPLNPYGPPVVDPGVRKVDDANQSHLSVQLLGHPTHTELNACLAAEQRGNWLGFSALLVFFLVPALVAAANTSLPSLFLVCAGVCGGVVVMYAVSQVRYRAGVFENEFPQWAAMDGGQIDSDGITLFEGDSWLMYRWRWFSHAVVAGNVISFVPALRSKCPVLVGQNMLVYEGFEDVVSDWEAFCKSSVDFLDLSRGAFYKKRLTIDPAQTRSNVELICNRARLRTISPEPGSVSFCGDVTTRDLEQVSKHAVALTRTFRSRFVVGSLLICGGLIAGGLSALLLGAFWILLGFYCMLILAWNIKARTTRVRPTQRRHYFMLGYVTDEHIVLDLGIVLTSFAWHEIKVLAADHDWIAIQSGRLGQPVVLRRDMFETAEQWNHVVEKACIMRRPRFVEVSVTRVDSDDGSTGKYPERLVP